MNGMISKKKIPSKMYSSEELVSKEQRKDIKNFKNIAPKLGIPPTILSIIQQSGTMNEIVYHLYHFIRKNSNKKQLEIFERNRSSCEYSSFVITYPIIEEVFHHIEDKKYSFNELAISIGSIYQMTKIIIADVQKRPEVPNKNNYPPIIMDKPTDLIKNIKSKSNAIDTIYEHLGIKKEKEYEEIYNLIIRLFYRYKIDQYQDYDENDYLLSTSKYVNSNNNEIEIIIPFCSLGSFIKYNKDKIKNHELLWLLFIAKELSFLQNNYIYFNNISTDSIGLYFNAREKELIPLIVPYYYYRKMYNEGTSKTTEVQNYDAFYFNDKKIIELYNHEGYSNQLLKIARDLGCFPDEIITMIEESVSMNSFITSLETYIDSKIDKSELDLSRIRYSNSDYSAYQMTYPVMEELFNYLASSNFSFKELTSDFNAIFRIIYTFLDNIQKHLEINIQNSIPIK